MRLVAGEADDTISVHAELRVGIARARTKIGLANLVYNVKRLIVLERWAVLAAA